jgi:hypothetical protein
MVLVCQNASRSLRFLQVAGILLTIIFPFSLTAEEEG